MSSDKARRSYDPARMYRSVVSQQGRVTLEADANEAEEIRAEESRAELIDIVGPAGVPGDGFKIAVPADTLRPFDFLIGQGSFYVGGLRVVNPDGKATYLRQQETEWIDYPARRPGDEPAGAPLTELVYLTLAEQEVSAVEDEALREVALGGPDTATRLRLLQRVQRLRVDGSTCRVAFAQVLKNVYGTTADFDPETMRLVSRARLRVDFDPPPNAADVCHPTARAGFLGPENQLIRVQVSETGTLLWGWDNASFLYRVTITTPGPKAVITLGGIPVDVFHQPRANQYVELLGTAAELGGDASMASPVGSVLQVDGYDSTSRRVTLKTEVPGDFVEKHPRQLFVRVWENQLDFAASEDTPTVLLDADKVSTGVRVFAPKTLRVPGDYWMIAVRPSTPEKMFPTRLATPQPPDGPQRWVAPLAVIEWEGERRARRVTDCRPPFLDLVELTQRKAEPACELVVSPAAHASKTLTLQDAINTVVKAGGGAICLEAGIYKLEGALAVNGAKSLRITGKGPASCLQSPGVPKVEPKPGTAGSVALTVSGSTFVTLEAFRVERTDGKGINAIEVSNSTQVRIERLQIDGDEKGDGDWAAGIALGDALEDVAIRENRITADKGIVDDKIATGLADLRVEDNLFVCATTGVWLANVSIHQGVSRFAGNRVWLCGEAGFQLQGATVPGCAVEVIGNEIEVIGVGILTGLDGVRIADNDLAPWSHDLPGAPPVSRGKHGIVMTTGSAPTRGDDAQITGNRITKFEVGILGAAPLGSVAIARNQISTCRTGLRVESFSTMNLIVADNQITGIDDRALVIATEKSEKSRITVSDNQLQATGNARIVEISGNADCLFCQNQCDVVESNDNFPTVDLAGRSLVVTSNRVGGTVALTCKSTPTKVPQALCTVVGNVSGRITINTITLAMPWDPLNVPHA
jgi:hypothetical protein